MIAKASREKPLAGGVLADRLGAGKTVTVIGLILHEIQMARANCDPKRGRSGATLVVVPNAILAGQWDDMIKVCGCRCI